MKLITSDSVLRKYIPNVIGNVTGEVSLFDKLTSYLDIAEEWVKNTFTSEVTFNTICGYADNNIIKTYTAKVVVSEAFRRAVPSLDVVLTPNGFGIVSNSNIAPASKERVSRLVESLEAERDGAIRLLLSVLVGASKWTSSAQYEYFTATMFHNLDICDYLGVASLQWQKYQEVRPALLEMEQHIATQFLGAEQYAILRKESVTLSSASHLVKSVIRSLRAYEAQTLKDKLSKTVPLCSPPTTLIGIVNIIRNNPNEFPQWHNSSIAALYSPAVFENKKDDKGYWF